jgi:2-dehydro-3-deoxyphosphooctonate aldolase (KDO 8-P synthase)
MNEGSAKRSNVCAVGGRGEQGGGGFAIGAGNALAVIAGPCAIESRELCLRIAEHAKGVCDGLGLPYVFKASFDKANRSSVSSGRGPGLDDGLRVLEAVRDSLGVPVTTDVHLPEQAAAVAQVVDVLQIPAFLCRQTDLLVACAEAAASQGRAVNIKKGQFLSPAEMRGPLGKCVAAGCRNLMLTERGTFFGYHRLVTDLIGLGDMMDLTLDEAGNADGSGGRVGAAEGRGQAGEGGGAFPVCFDATHSAQLPGASATTGGRRERVPLLARAAVAAGVDAVFIETHPEPEAALSDRATMLPLSELWPLLRTLAAIRHALSDAGAVAR